MASALSRHQHARTSDHLRGYVGVRGVRRAQALRIARKKPADEALMLLVGEMENAFTGAEIALADMIGWRRRRNRGRCDQPRTGAPDADWTERDPHRRARDGGCRGASFYRDVGLERAFRDVQAARFHPLQAKPQMRYTGRVALELDIDG